MPTRKKKHDRGGLPLKQVHAVARKGQEWFKKHLDQMQKLPQGTLVLLNVENGEYLTTPPAWDDVEKMQAQWPANDHVGYWMFRITEGADGKKEIGGVYSVGSVQAVA